MSYDLVLLITALVNASLFTCTVPTQFKQSVVIPLLNKSGLDINNLEHLRLMSNLPCVSNVLENVVLRQLQKHLSGNDLFEMHTGRTMRLCTCACAGVCVK